MWYDKIDYRNLKSFRFATFVHIKGDKLPPRALRCTFIGYPEGVKRYKLWYLEEGRQGIIISRDVAFNEMCYPMLSKRRI